MAQGPSEENEMIPYARLRVNTVYYVIDPNGRKMTNTPHKYKGENVYRGVTSASFKSERTDGLAEFNPAGFKFYKKDPEEYPPPSGSQSAGTKRRKLKKTLRRRSASVTKKSQRKQRK